jgi:hypothetical protein
MPVSTVSLEHFAHRSRLPPFARHTRLLGARSESEDDVAVVDDEEDEEDGEDARDATGRVVGFCFCLSVLCFCRALSTSCDAGAAVETGLAAAAAEEEEEDARRGADAAGVDAFFIAGPVRCVCGRVCVRVCAPPGGKCMYEI